MRIEGQIHLFLNFELSNSKNDEHQGDLNPQPKEVFEPPHPLPSCPNLTSSRLPNPARKLAPAPR